MRLCAVLLAALMLAAAPAAALDKPRDWEPPPPAEVPNHRAQWREVVVELSSYAKKRDRNFLVLARGGAELMIKGEREAVWEQVQDPENKTFEKRLPLGTVMRSYALGLDGLVVDGLYCGPMALGKPLDQAIRERQEQDARQAIERRQGIHREPPPQPVGPFSNDPAVELRRHEEIKKAAYYAERQLHTLRAAGAMLAEGRRILSIEDCPNAAEATKAQAGADRDKVLSFIGTGIGRLDVLPSARPAHENADAVTTLNAARNWLALTRAARFGSRAEMIRQLERANYDLLLVDVSHRGGDHLTKEDVGKLKFKGLGPPRLVLAVLPVGKAYDWRWYWRKGWQAGEPSFLFAPDDEPGAFIVDLSDKKWRETLGKYITGIMDLGFDGVVLDDLDTHRWFEELMPLDG